MKPERRVIGGVEYVLLRPKSYEHLREELSIARHLVENEKEHNESTLRWARECCARGRNMAARCSFLYGVALARGASTEELRG